MGINLRALQIQKRAAAEVKNGRVERLPIWWQIVTETPPAQVLTRQQPQKHVLTQTRTRSLPDGTTVQVTTTPSHRKPKKARASRLFAPVELKYEEDALRKQFFQDHPWELARPRMVLETSGNQHKDSNYAKSLAQQNLSVSGESLVQRQLHLLQTVPDITVDQSYDIVRREFYASRRKEAVQMRVAKEEALHMGAQPEKGPLQWGMQVENQVYNEWERWAEEEVLANLAKSAAFSGEAMPGEESILADTTDTAAEIPNGPSPFTVQSRQNQKYNTGDV